MSLSGRNEMKKYFQTFLITHLCLNLYLVFCYKVNGEPVVYLTVSSLASGFDVEDRHLQLNWYNNRLQHETDDASIRLYSHEPRDKDSGYLESIRPGGRKDGYHRTSIRFPEQVFHPQNLTNLCLGFWIAYVVNEQVVNSSCIRARPNWMHESKYILEYLRLSDIIIPGTHNAGCYGKFQPNQDDIVNKYVITQEESIWNQLVYGIRYLDLRVAFNKHGSTQDQFWITHSIYTTEISVRKVLSQVKAFLDATKEIIIMDFHRFVGGFGGKQAEQIHSLFIQFLESELSDYMIPATSTLHVTFSELWATNRRLLVAYASDERSNSVYLFPGVKHLWADKDRTDHLFQFFDENICKQPKPQLTSAMTQLTPTVAGTVFDIYGGVRSMAHNVNYLVTRHLRERWWRCANIITTDFFLENNVIETSIEFNKIKFSS